MANSIYRNKIIRLNYLKQLYRSDKSIDVYNEIVHLDRELKEIDASLAWCSIPTGNYNKAKAFKNGK